MIETDEEQESFEWKNFSFKKICFKLSLRGLGSYLEILNEWTLDDYQNYIETIIEDKKNGR